MIRFTNWPNQKVTLNVILRNREKSNFVTYEYGLDRENFISTKLSSIFTKIRTHLLNQVILNNFPKL